MLYERRRSHVRDVVRDHAFAGFCWLTVLLERTHLTGYLNLPARALLGALVAACAPWARAHPLGAQRLRWDALEEDDALVLESNGW